MGMCLEGFGRVSIEVRRESFVIHPDDDAFEVDGLHPEFYLSDLDDLIKALEDVRDYVKKGRKR